MSTTKTRINISLPDYLREALIKSASREQIPQATKAAHLLELAMEIEEDEYWHLIAEKRDTAKARYVSHTTAWKRR